MPTNEERKQIAENLRNMTAYGCRYAEQFYELLQETVMDIVDFHDFGDVANRLADLIEPEERTVVLKDNGRCPDCDKLIGEGERYCAWCGAKVVE